MLIFPKNFVWGAATASYQIEGAVDADGRGESIWDRFSHTPGKTRDGDTGDVACDHYHRWRDDLALMKQLGLSAYRFSIAWPRILPNGRGHVNEQGLAFYDQLVDALLAANIQPYVTLYHWDLPQALEDAGGWLNRDITDAFVDYAQVVVKRLGDRVKQWTTHNEPFCTAFLGYRWGVHAPGISDETKSLQAAHHVLLSHGLATQAIRALRSDAQVGIVLNMWTVETLQDTPVDRAFAEMQWQKDCGWFLDPVLRGQYPAQAWAAYERYESKVPTMQPADLKTIAQPLDYLGLNYYMRALYEGTQRAPHQPDTEYTEMDWEVHAPGLYRLLTKLQREYPAVPIYITENGAAFKDTVVDGAVPDPRRVNYLREHIAACRQAIADGVDLRGYFAWSLLDNFEWSHGYSKRFGLTYVDYATQQRIPKDSFEFYREVIKRNGVD
ncbi:MAG: beta-glucosidase [Thermoflexales bacterium]|nr:beta-glucosidase [Thermoflexales bacterium]